MTLIPKILVALISLEHIYILYVEMFAWTTMGRKISPHLTEDFIHESKSLAANQGLYNGFIAAGLIWSLIISDPTWSHNIGLFFTSCVVIAGVYGGVTTSKGILMKQGLPAVVTLIALLVL